MSQKFKAKPSHILIHIGGACIRNPGPGGYAAILRWVDGDTVLRRAIVHGRRQDTTNVRMGMLAALNALTALSAFGDEDTPSTVVSDNQTLVRGAMEWLPNWMKHGWKRADGMPVANAKLWATIAVQMSRRSVNFRWVKGHAGDPFNEEVARRARAQAKLRPS